MKENRIKFSLNISAVAHEGEEQVVLLGLQENIDELKDCTVRDGVSTYNLSWKIFRITNTTMKQHRRRYRLQVIVTFKLQTEFRENRVQLQLAIYPNHSFIQARCIVVRDTVRPSSRISLQENKYSIAYKHSCF